MGGARSRTPETRVTLVVNGDRSSIHVEAPKYCLASSRAAIRLGCLSLWLAGLGIARRRGKERQSPRAANRALERTAARVYLLPRRRRQIPLRPVVGRCWHRSGRGRARIAAPPPSYRTDLRSTSGNPLPR